MKYLLDAVHSVEAPPEAPDDPDAPNLQALARRAIVAAAPTAVAGALLAPRLKNWRLVIAAAQVCLSVVHVRWVFFPRPRCRPC
eukprot:9489895-Pyramimonas_sp.AAC.1